MRMCAAAALAGGGFFPCYCTLKLVLAKAPFAAAFTWYVPFGSALAMWYFMFAAPDVPVVPLRVTTLPFGLVMVAVTGTPPAATEPDVARTVTVTFWLLL